MLALRLDPLLVVAGLCLAAGCPTDAATPSGASGAAPRSPATVPPANEVKAPAGGRVLPEAPLPLLEILGATPAEAERQFGEPIAKGGTKKTCVRFVPERVFFGCEHAWQRYADRTGTFGALEVNYEDGRVASIAFEQIPGDGPFDPRVALAKVGLELPGEPQKSEPAPNVALFSWFNSSARLLVHEQQYRVEVSAVGGDWTKSKVDLILNHPLTDAQKAKVVEPERPSPG